MNQINQVNKTDQTNQIDQFYFGGNREIVTGS